MAVGTRQRPGNREESRRKHVLLPVGLAELAHPAQDRQITSDRDHVRVGLAATASIGPNNRTSAFARLLAWQKTDQRLERLVKLRVTDPNCRMWRIEER